MTTQGLHERVAIGLAGDALASDATLRVPLASVDPQFDIDAPRYRASNPATYLLLALCYDTLAAPSTRAAPSGLLNDAVEPDYGRMLPRLAEAFTENPDATWTLRLRRGVLSHDGNELGAEDIKWILERAFALNTFAAYRWGQIAGLPDAHDSIRVVDGHTLSFRLRAPNPHFATFFFSATPMIVDSAAIRSHATKADPWGTSWLSERHVAGFGPYGLDTIAPDTVAFSARPDYWGGSPRTSRVVAYRVGSRAEALSALDSREPAYVAGVRPDEIGVLRARSNVVISASWGGHTYIGMNYARPPFDDVRVRRALSCVTPYEAIVDKGFLGFARRWHGPVPSFDAWYADTPRDSAGGRRQAKALLAEAGYGAGFRTALYVGDRPDVHRIVEILVPAYREVGVELEIRNMNTVPAGWCPPLYLRVECGHNHNEPVYDLAHDYMPINPVLPAPGGWGGTDTWFGRYPGSRMLEDMYRTILVAPTSSDRRERCLKMQQAVVDFAPVVFIAENIQLNAANRGWAHDYSDRLVQALQFQNCNSNYLPG